MINKIHERKIADIKTDSKHRFSCWKDRFVDNKNLFFQSYLFGANPVFQIAANQRMKALMNLIVTGVIITTIISCNQKTNNKITPKKSQTITKKVDTTAPKKEFGDRFSIVGDFNGDKKMDTIYESYISSLTNKETYKILDSMDWDRNQELIMKNKPITRIYSSMQQVDTLLVADEAQQMGLFHFRNLGDLNGDGKDEIGYAIKWVDQSNLNHYYIISLIDNQFKEIFSFQVNESIFYDESEELFDNGEFIKKNRDKSILYQFYSDSATFEIGEHKF
ncbi:hypothetical protein HNQ02_003300 [Flavobacterium sp. 7E]|uniref:hypothetical protein n=1 Tax=Flavobacterium sp. 7E TaxID=2735898 RepID=UPI00156F78EE|nr:hypothetical protein [Flavobacterium sp. 7E]NRS90360.1 hypothetical protein [Flavobacterium sp. 7E]